MPHPRKVATVVALVAAVLAVLVAAPWRLVDVETPDGGDRGEQVVVRDDNPAPRSELAEQLDDSRRGEREFVQGIKDAARAENAERVRRDARREQRRDQRRERD